MTTGKQFITVFRTLILMLIASSCASSYNSIVVETPNPSSDILPSEITSLTLMNRGVTDEFKNFDRDSLQHYFYSNSFNVNAVVLDSLAADTMLMVLGDLLYGSGRYDVVIPRDRYFDRDQEFSVIPDELAWEKVRVICEEFNTDALLVVERFYNKINTKFSINPATTEYYTHVVAVIDSEYDVVIRIYDPARERVVSMLVAADTISWRDADLSNQTLFARLPSIKDCLIETAIQASLDLDNQLSPTWSPETRGYFSIGEADDASLANLIKDNQWEAAYDYWLQFVDSPNKATRSKARYNMALASEMLGRIDESVEWADSSNKTQYRTQTDKYMAILDHRKDALQQMISGKKTTNR